MEVQNLVEENGGHLVKSSPNTPRSQGKDERSHQTWKRYLRFDQRSADGCFLWTHQIKKYQRNYNEMVHRSLGKITVYVGEHDLLQ